MGSRSVSPEVSGLTETWLYYKPKLSKKNGFASSRHAEQGHQKGLNMNGKEFDEIFDSGEDVTHLLDLSTIRRPRLELRKVNVDFPVWMIQELDHESTRLGITRQSLIKSWIGERLDEIIKNRTVLLDDPTD